jgi:SAM-dependent methyltransferase
MPDTIFSSIILGTHPDSRDFFSRLDERDDTVFYSRERFVPHLDSKALETVEKLIDTLIIEKNPAILDLMASWDSHLPSRIHSGSVIGLGMNEQELNGNQALTDYVLHDLNRDPRLPFRDGMFDVVLNTVSVDYLMQPLEVFREVNRILKPGGLFLVIFSNRMFPEKAVKIWRESSEDERIMLVEDLFRETGAFDEAKLFVSKGKPRPKDDKYAHLGTPSDPIYAVYAEKAGKNSQRMARPTPRSIHEELLSKDDLERKKREIKHTLRCPYCGSRLKKWAVPDNPFEVTWDNEFLYICFNDQCSYYVRGWDYIYQSTNRMASYRFMYNPDKDTSAPIPVPSPKALRESIIDD